MALKGKRDLAENFLVLEFGRLLLFVDLEHAHESVVVVIRIAHLSFFLTFLGPFMLFVRGDDVQTP